MGLKLMGTHKILVYVHDENLLGNTINIINTTKNNIKALTDVSNEVGVEVNREQLIFNFLGWSETESSWYVGH
jgi:hypothetical protein